MGKSMRSMLLLAKAQPTIDVDPTPVVGTDAILCRGMTPSLIEAEFVERTLILPYKAAMADMAVGVHRSFEFEIEAAGSGVAGTAPKWGPILKACGFSETIVAITSVTYAPITLAQPMVALYGFIDNVKFVMLNCWGTVAMEFNAKGIPVLKFRMIGTYNALTEPGFPTGIVYAGFVQPKTVGKLNTPTFTFQGGALLVDQFSVDMQAALVFRDLIGGSAIHSPNRNPGGSMSCEMPAIATKDFGELVKLGTTGAVQLIHGTTAGNIIKLDAPMVQCNAKPTLQNKDDVAMVQVPFGCLPSAGNDEVTLTLT